MTLVSVIVASYNSEAFLARTLDSILCQTEQDLEIIIIDDSSIDSSLEIAKGYEARYPNVIVIHNVTNLGAAMSRNKGIARAEGRYIAICDSDDIWHQKKLQIQIAAAKLGFPIIGSSCNIVDENGEFLSKKIYNGLQNENYRKFRPFPPHSALLFDTYKLMGDLKYSSEFTPAEDYNLILNLSKSNHIFSVPEVLVDYRVHRNNISKLKYGEFGQASLAVKSNVIFRLKEIFGTDNSRVYEDIDFLLKHSRFDHFFNSFTYQKSILKRRKVDRYTGFVLPLILLEKLISVDVRRLLSVILVQIVLLKQRIV